MRIPGDIPKIPGIYDKQKNAGMLGRTDRLAPKKDVVSISGQAKDFQSVMKALKNVPDIRQDKVDEIMRKYQAGNYTVDGRDVVEKAARTIFDRKA